MTIRIESREIEKRKDKSNEMKSWFFEKSDKMDKLLAWLENKKENTQSTNIRCERRDVTNEYRRILSASFC